VYFQFHWQIAVRVLVTWFPVLALHELGHVLVGWLQGARGAEIRFGNPANGHVVELRMGPLNVVLHLGVGLWFFTPRYHFRREGRCRPLALALRALAGPIVSFIVFAAFRGRLISADLPMGGVSLDSWGATMAWWGLMSAVFPLIPWRYASVNMVSDGMVIYRSVLALYNSRNNA
jgi:hypothetical protein